MDARMDARLVARLQKYTIKSPFTGVVLSEPPSRIPETALTLSTNMRNTLTGLRSICAPKAFMTLAATMNPKHIQIGAGEIEDEATTRKYYCAVYDHTADVFTMYYYNGSAWADITGAITQIGWTSQVPDSCDWKTYATNGALYFSNTYNTGGNMGKLLKCLAGVLSNVTNYPTGYQPTTVREIQNHLVCGSQDRLLWCDLNDETNWTTNEAGNTTLNDWILQIENCRDFGIIYCKKSIKTIQYVGYPNIWKIADLTTDIGIKGTGCVANLNNRHYFISDISNAGVFMTDGVTLENIGMPIFSPDNFDLAPVAGFTALQSVSVNRAKREIWLIPYGSTATYPIYIYNTLMNSWSPYNPSSTITQYTNQGNKFSTPLIVIDNSTLVYKCESGNTSADTTLATTVRTKLFDLGMPDKIKRVQRVQIVPSLTTTLYDLTIKVGSCNNPSETLTWSSGVTLDLGSIETFVDVDVSARYHMIEITSAGTASAGAKPFDIQEISIYYIPREMV